MDALKRRAGRYTKKLQQSSEFMTKSGGEIAQGKAKDAGGLTPAKDDNAALRDCYSRTFAGNSDDCYRK